MERYIHIIVNSSIKMSQGKAMVQACHAVSSVTERMIKSQSERWGHYTRHGSGKIIHRASEEQMRQLIDLYGYNNQLWCQVVLDAGRNQVEAGTLTAIAFLPLALDETPTIIKEFKLY